MFLVIFFWNQIFLFLSFTILYTVPFISMKNDNSWTFHRPLIMNRTTTMSIASCSCQVGWDLNLAVTALNSVEMMKLHCIIKLFGVKNRRNTPLECCLSCMVALHRTTTAFRGDGSCNVTVRDRSFECQVVQSVNVLSFVAVSLQSRFKSARRWEGIVCGGPQVVWLWFPRWGSNTGRKTAEEERCSGWKDSQGVGWY